MNLIAKNDKDEDGVECYSVFIDNDGTLTWVGFIYSGAVAEYINSHSL